MSASGTHAYVSTGFLDLVETRGELAAAIAHSLAHVRLRHQWNAFLAEREAYEAARNRAIKKQRILRLASMLVTVGTGVAGGIVAGTTFGTIQQVGVQGGVLLSRSADSVRVQGTESFAEDLPSRRAVFNRLGWQLSAARNPKYYVAPTVFCF